MLSSSQLLGPPVPSPTYVKYYIYSLLVRHPLIINPPIYHPITGTQQRITKWRTYSGRELSEDLVCAIFVASNLSESITMIPPNNWNAGSTSVVYAEPNLGRGKDVEDKYFINIKLYYNGLKLGVRSEDENLIEVPREAVTHPDQYLHTSRRTESVELLIDPIDDILGNYLGLLRIVLMDKPHRYIRSLMPLDDIEPLYGNLRSLPWDKEDGIYMREADLMVRVTAHTNVGWRDRFLTNVREVSLNVDNMGGR